MQHVGLRMSSTWPGGASPAASRSSRRSCRKPSWLITRDADAVDRAPGELPVRPRRVVLGAQHVRAEAARLQRLAELQAVDLRAGAVARQEVVDGCSTLMPRRSHRGGRGPAKTRYSVDGESVAPPSSTAAAGGDPRREAQPGVNGTASSYPPLASARHGGVVGAVG